MGLVIEGLVAILLVVTIGYCIVLNRQLKGLRTDEATMRRTVAELLGASETAAQAVTGLKRTVADHEAALAEKIEDAQRIGAALDVSLADGEDIIRRLRRIVQAARPMSAMPGDLRAADDHDGRPARGHDVLRGEAA